MRAARSGSGYFLAAYFASMSVLYGGPPQPDASDAWQARARRDAAIENLAFHATIHDRTRKGMLPGAPFIERTQAIDALVQVVDRPAAPRLNARYEIVTTLDPERVPEDPTTGEPFAQIAITCVLTPEECRLIEPATDGRTRLGRIANRPVVALAASPLELLSHGGVFQIASLDQVVGVGSEVIDAYQCLRIDWQIENTAGPPGSALKGSDWIAPDLDYAPVREQVSRRVGASGSWREILDKHAEGFSPHDGIHLPAKVTLRRHNAYDDGSYELTSEIVATFDAWRVNRPLSPGAFTLDFPDGTIVSDEIRGETYTKGAITDASVSRQVVRAQALASDVNATTADPGLDSRFRAALDHSPFAWRRRWTWMLVFLAGVFGCAALAILWIRRNSGLQERS